MTYARLSRLGLRRAQRRESSLISGINITPMVDVMLVLLVIFMITAPLLSSGVDVSLPQAQGKALDASQAPIVLTIDSSGTIYYQHDVVSQSQLKSRVAKALSADAGARFFVRADHTVSYGHLMAVVGTLSAQGARSISFITDPSKGLAGS